MYLNEAGWIGTPEYVEKIISIGPTLYTMPI
jgi:hypothetical protein